MRFETAILALLVFWTAGAAAADGGPARLVTDLAPGTRDTYPSYSGFARLGNRAVFVGLDNEAGPALKVTDGTPEGTRTIAVLCPPCNEAQLLGSNGRVAFYRVSLDYTRYGSRIWRTDGTPAGTFPVTEGFKLPNYAQPGGFVFLTSLNGDRLFFTACTPDLGCELWSSDGTTAGTAPFELAPGPAHATIRDVKAVGDHAYVLVGKTDATTGLWLADGPRRTVARLAATPTTRDLTTSGSRAFFVADHATLGREVWTSDGTAAGTFPVTRFGPEGPFGQTGWLTPIDGRVYFVANDGTHGPELWSTAGQVGSQRRLTRVPDGKAAFSSPVKSGGRLVFTVIRSYEPRLWSTRGDLASTAQVAGCPGGCPIVQSELVGTSGGLVFKGSAATAGAGNALWVTNGTGAGTRLLKRTAPNRTLFLAKAVGGRALIEVTEEYEIGDLFITDGTQPGTFQVGQGGPSWSHYFGWRGDLLATAAGNRLVFPALSGGLETLWSSDGTAAGSRPIADTRVGVSSNPDRLTPFRDGLLAAACTGTTRNVFFLRAAPAATETVNLLSQPSTDCSYSLALRMVALDTTAVFLTQSDEGLALWGTDGTAAGTQAIVPAAPADEPEDVVRFGTKAAYWLLVPQEHSYRSELWLTDGTPAGTSKIVELPGEARLYSLTAAGGKLYFFNVIEQGETWLYQPWVSDGTAAGTHALMDGGGLAWDGRFVDAGDRVFFLFATSGPDFRNLEIWSTDGTVAGTGPAVTAASGMSTPGNLSASQGRLFFAARRLDDLSGGADDSTVPVHPWSTDLGGLPGNADAETRLLSEATISSEAFAPQATFFVEMNGRVYFAAADPVHGDELWSTDGTPGGTGPVADLAPGTLGSYPRDLAVWNGRLYFRARRAQEGMELFSSDGTAAGTRLVQNIARGASWSLPSNLTPAADALWFTANDGIHGREIWELPE